MFPFATTRSKTIQSSSMVGGLTKELIEATSLEGFWPPKKNLLQILT